MKQERKKSSRRHGSELPAEVLAMLPRLVIMFTVLDFSIANSSGTRRSSAVCQGRLGALRADHAGANRITIAYQDPSRLAPVTGANSNAGGNRGVTSASGLPGPGFLGPRPGVYSPGSPELLAWPVRRLSAPTLRRPQSPTSSSIHTARRKGWPAAGIAFCGFSTRTPPIRNQPL